MPLYLSGELVATLGALEIPHAFVSPHVYAKLLDSWQEKQDLFFNMMTQYGITDCTLTTGRTCTASYRPMKMLLSSFARI